MRIGLIAVTSAAAAALAAAAGASAAIDPNVPGFTVPAFYGQPATTYQEWAGFTSPAGPNPPTTSTNGAGTADWVDTTTATDGAFLIGSPPTGHVYSFSGTVTPAVTVPVPAATSAGELLTVVLQAEALGNGLSASSFLLTTAGGSPASPTSLTDTAVPISGGGFGGDQFDYVVTWAGLPAPTGETAYTLDYAAAGTSSSQTAARVDTLTATAAAVPEPATLGLAGVACVAGLARRRRR